MTKPYCGINSVIPRGYHPGDLDECAKASQVRRYGIHRTTLKEVNNALASKKEKKKIAERKSYLISKLSSMTALINKYNSYLNVTGSQSKSEKSKLLIKEAKENLPKIKEKYSKYRREYQAL